MLALPAFGGILLGPLKLAGTALARCSSRGRSKRLLVLDDLPALMLDPAIGRGAISAVRLAASPGAHAVSDDDQTFLRPADPEIIELDRRPARRLRHRLDRLAAAHQERRRGHGHQTVRIDRSAVDFLAADPEG